MKKECIAMLLAKEQESNLCVLNKELAKPAAPFGGNYRMIYFPLSNCIHSGIDTVGVLTQYQPRQLDTCIGDDQHSDPDRINGGVSVLPLYSRCRRADWNKGTANVIYQNMAFIRKFDPEYLLILSGSHAYRMDYSLMLDEHKKNNADVTIAVTKVPLEKASRYSIVNCDSYGHITHFWEKPEAPRSNLASMGVYIFNWKLLRPILIEDAKDSASINDFDKNIIPKMLESGKKLFIHRFNGYWKDVRTIESLWEASTELLSPAPRLNSIKENRKIYYRGTSMPPGFIAKSARVSNSLIADGAKIFGEVENSIIFPNVTVAKSSKIQYSIVMPGAIIEEGAHVQYSVVAEKCRVGKQSHMDRSLPQRVKDREITEVSEGATVETSCAIP